MKLKINGFDPSMSNFGIAQCLVDPDTFEVEVVNLILHKTTSEAKKGVIKQSDDLRRAREVCAAMTEASRHVALAVSEIPFMNPAGYALANWNAAMMVGVLASCPVPLIQVSPQDVKMAAVGTRTAAKEEMIEWAVAKHPNANWLTMKRGGKLVPTAANEHLADAVAAVYAGMKTVQFQQAAAMYRSMREAA